LQARHDQMPIECRLTVFLPQKEHAAPRQPLSSADGRLLLTVPRVLRDFHLLDLFPQRGAVAVHRPRQSCPCRGVSLRVERTVCRICRSRRPLEMRVSREIN
jgi:hypothetical protein